MEKHKSLIRLVEQKIYNIVNSQLRKHIEPSITFEEVKQIDLELVKKLKSNYGISGIILDVDDTIRKDMLEVPDCNKKWIEFMKQEFKIIILSNGYDGSVKEFANKNGIEYIGFAKKPLRKGFLKCCEKMCLEPENVLVVGDDIIADIYGGNRCGMFTAIVNSVRNESTIEL